MVSKVYAKSHLCSSQTGWLVRAAVAAAISGNFAMSAMAADAADTDTTKTDEVELEEIQVTGSRIVRRDLQSNSPLVTIEKERLEENTFISIEEALNDLPQFMVGGVNNSTASVTSLQAANGLDGGRGAGDASNGSLLDPGGTIGIVVPGAATANLRGLGANRSLTLIDGHRGMPTNASMTVDLNTIPTIAIANVEVITGGASAVYGADALAGVTNFKMRDNFEGLAVRMRSGINEVGDGEEYQVSGLMGAKLADGKGSAMMGIEYSKREEATWGKRDFFREVLESPYSGSGDFLFPWDAYYTAGPAGSAGTFAIVQSFATQQRVWGGNAPSVDAVNGVFSTRNCFNGSTTALNCIATGVGSPTTGETNQVLGGGPALGSGYHFNSDGTLFVRSSSCLWPTPTPANPNPTNPCGPGAVQGVTYAYGPQNYKNTALGGTRENPDEIACTFTAVGTVSNYAPFAGQRCNPSASNRADYGRWLSSPREAYTLFGRGKYQFDNGVEAFANFSFANSKTFTRREPSPALGLGFNAVIPFGQNEIYLPSLITVPAAGQTAGATRPEYRAGGAKGLNCPATGGCTMAQAFPLAGDVFDSNGQVITRGNLRTLLESRPNVTIPLTPTNTNNPFRGLSACQDYQLVPFGATNPVAQTNPNAFYPSPNNTTPIRYTVTIDPNTGLPVSKCGVRSGWALNQQLKFLPVRGTENTGQLYNLDVGLRGDLHLSDWTWEVYLSQGDSKTQTSYDGFTSLANYLKILSAPNYGKGYAETGQSSKFFTCTSGLNPFDQNLAVSQDCINAIQSNQIDRNSMTQRIYEVTTQGHVVDLPAGDVRAALGVSYRKNAYKFTPDSLREADYTMDANSGAFAQGSIDEAVSVKEVYGELLVPILKDLPGIQTLELELGARHSDYSTGQKVDTYKVQASWTPVQWLRARGGYNRAERAPNMSELFSTPTGSSQFASAAVDPCRTGNLVAPPNNLPLEFSNNAANPNVAQLRALCSSQINFWGGNNASDFHTNPAWDVPGGVALVVGNPALRNEKGDTWTVGLVLASPFEHPLLSRLSGTVDWYEARVTDPIEVQATTAVVNSCFNVNGANPTYSLDDAGGYCALIERDPSSGAITRVYNTYGNQGKAVIRGMDFTLRWSATLSDLGMGGAPGTVSVDTQGNYLIDQIQRFSGSTDRFADYAGFAGASRFRAVTNFAYRWGEGSRVSLQWMYRLGTDTPATFVQTASPTTGNGPIFGRNPLFAGYHTSNMFALTGGTRLGPVNASVTINNLLNSKPSRGGYDLRDPNQGIGTFSPFDDLVGRRYSINLSMDF
jgi:outer membrane receptor protein involved in Fe transport